MVSLFPVVHEGERSSDRFRFPSSRRSVRDVAPCRYRVEVASHPLTGADVPVGTRAIVLVVSDPYWRIERICLICTAIRNSAPNLPLIVVGPNDIETKVTLFELGADDYVVEPFDRVEFLARLDSLIRRLGRAAAFNARRQ